MRERLAQNEPKNPIRFAELADTWMALGNLRWKEDRFAEGAQSWQKAAKALDAATNPDADARGIPEISARWRALGFTYVKAGLWSEATVCFERPPAEPEIWLNTALLHLRTGNMAEYRQTCTVIRRLLEKAEKPEPFYNWACVLDNRVEVDAEQLYKSAKQAEEASQQPWLRFIRALACYRAGRFEEALAWANKSNDAWWTPHNITWPVLALAHHRLHHGAEARKWLEQANQEWRRLSPLAQSIQATNVLPYRDPPWWRSEAFWHDWTTFEILLREANALILGQRGEADGLDLLHRAYLHTKLGETQKAEEEFQAAVRGRAKDAKAWLARGRVYLLLGDKAHAKADFARGFELKPDDPEVWKERGRTHFALGQADKAAAAFAEALERLPTDGEDMRREIFAELDRADNLVSKAAALRPKDSKLAAFLRARKANARDSGPAGIVVAGNLLTNGGFEEGPDPGGIKVYQAGSTQLPGWTLSRGSVDVSGSWFLASHGSRCLDLDGDQPGGIQQTVPTKVGQRYRILFDLAGNPVYGDVLPAAKTLRVQAAGQSADFTFDATGRNIRALGWVCKQWEFTATASQTTVEFVSLDKEGGVGPLLDNIALVPVSEEGKKK